jgi:hypothetical protein
MRRRRHYATTGNRALLNVMVQAGLGADLFDSDPDLPGSPPATTPVTELMMGDIARVADDAVELIIDVVGSAPIERLDIFDGLDLLETVRPYTAADLGPRVRFVYEGAEYRGRARTTTWDGTLDISGNPIKNTKVINHWNLDRGIQLQNETSLSWKAVTTGNYGAIDLWLAEATDGVVSFRTEPVSGTCAIGELGVEPRMFEAGGLKRAISLQRLPAVMTERRLTLRRTIAVRPQGDTRLFVRVQQEDGHRMWSSPIYLWRA